MRGPELWATLTNVDTLLTRSVEDAAALIRRGGIVAFPTETVYGLGADVFSEVTIRKIFEAKQRPADNPLIAHIGRLEQVEDLAKQVPDEALVLIERFFPGPLTLVLNRKETVPSVATAGLETVGIRMPRHPVASRFLLECNTPLVAPSANLSGRPSPTTWQAVFEDLNGRIDCILQGDVSDIGLESTVVDCSSGTPVVLRKGAVSLEDLRDVLPTISEAPFVGSGPIRSPGLKHRHYSPQAEIILVNATANVIADSADGYIGLTRRENGFACLRVCGSVEEYAHHVFEFFRECDRMGVRKIYCETVDDAGIGAALMDRLRRAAEK